MKTKLLVQRLALPSLWLSSRILRRWLSFSLSLFNMKRCLFSHCDPMWRKQLPGPRRPLSSTHKLTAARALSSPSPRVCTLENSPSPAVGLVGWGGVFLQVPMGFPLFSRRVLSESSLGIIQAPGMQDPKEHLSFCLLMASRHPPTALFLLWTWVRGGGGGRVDPPTALLSTIGTCAIISPQPSPAAQPDHLSSRGTPSQPPHGVPRPKSDQVPLLLKTLLWLPIALWREESRCPA